jgi:hypothetical protein
LFLLFKHLVVLFDWSIAAVILLVILVSLFPSLCQDIK